MAQVSGIGRSVYDDSRLIDYTQDANESRGPMDLPFALLTLLLLAIGVVMVLSASFARAYYEVEATGGVATYYFTRQLLFAVAGVILMYIASRLPMSFYRRFAFTVLFVAIGGLVLVLIIGVGDSVGSKRWIDLGFTTFQPSEIAKVAIILTFSSMICTIGNKMNTIKEGVLPFAVVLVVVIGLLLAEPHISASIIIIAVAGVLMFVGGMKMSLFAGAIGIVAVAGIGIITLFPHASSRVSVWRDPFSDAADKGWQTIQSLYAVGSGGLLGNGLGQSRQKYLYLPEEHNDFIFSVVCEELGFIGACLILALFALLIVRGYWLAMHAKDRYSFLVCVGLTTLLALQVFLNIAVVTNLIPCTGISLPFFSYGGTALLMQLVQMGMILSISRDIPAKSD